MNVIKMFWAMFSGLFHFWEFDDKEDFFDWYWNQIPDRRYPGESLYDAWETFIYTVTFGGLRFELRMWYNRHFGKKQYGYSWSFDKNGYFVRDWKTNAWWFIPEDGSFSYGCAMPGWERENGNPIFN